jgi:hypothetical protein
MNVAKLFALAVVIVTTSPAYADISNDFSPVERATAKHDLTDAMNELEKLNLSGGDEILKYLNKGILLRMQGDYVQSNQNLEIAKQIMEQIQAISAKDKAEMEASNDTSKVYEALPSEQLAVFALKALNYLAAGKVEDAAAEAKLFDAKQSLLAKKNNQASYLSGAFVHYVNGLIFEKQGARDDARAEFVKAVDGYRKQGGTAPLSLSDSIRRIDSNAAKQSKITLIFQNGLGPAVKESITRVTNPSPSPYAPTMFNLSLPSHIARPAPVDHIDLSVGSVTLKSELVEDISALGEKSFKDRLPAIRERTIARLSAKVNDIADIKKSAKVANRPAVTALNEGAVDSVAVSERADIRSWALLPGNILMVSVPAPDGKALPVTATYYDAGGNKLGEKNFGSLTLLKGQTIYLSDYFINPNSILTPDSPAYYVSGPTLSRVSSESFSYIGVGIDISSGKTYSTLSSQIADSSGSTISNSSYVPDLSIYVGGYSGSLGWEVGYTAIGGAKTSYSRPGTNSSYITTDNDSYTLRGDALYGAFLWRTNTSNDFFYFKGGLANTSMSLQNGGGIYPSGTTSTTGYGPLLGVGWESGAFRFELQSLKIQLPTPNSTIIDGSTKSSAMLTTFNLGIVF